MAQDKGTAVATTTPFNEAPNSSPSTTSQPADNDAGVKLAERGATLDHDAAVDAEDQIRRQHRTLLSAQEEKALLRRIDWRIMSVCSLLFLLKTIDTDNVSNARIMNRGTDRNIMTELNMTSDQYNLLNVLYYVSTTDFATTGILANLHTRSLTSYLKRHPTYC